VKTISRLSFYSFTLAILDLIIVDYFVLSCSGADLSLLIWWQMSDEYVTLAGHSYCEGVGGAPPLLLRLLAYLGYSFMPEYTIRRHNRRFGLSYHVATVFIRPHLDFPTQGDLTFQGRESSYEGSVQAAAFNAITFIRDHYSGFLSMSPFRFYLGQPAPDGPLNECEFIAEPDPTIVETAPMLTITHRLYRSAAYERDFYHDHLHEALDFIRDHIGSQHAPPHLMALHEHLRAPHSRHRPPVCSFSPAYGHYSSRHSVLMYQGQRRRQREPLPGQVPRLFRRPQLIPPEAAMYFALQ